MLAKSPSEWLLVLANRLDERSPRISLLRSYQDGHAPLPQGGENVRASWARFQKESRTNWGGLILEAVTDRIVVKGVTVAGDSQSPVADQANRIWRDNRMDSVFASWLRDGLAYGEAYLTCWAGDDGRAIITAESPECMVVASDPLQPWRVRAAARFWRDDDVELDYALVMAGGMFQYFTRPAREGDHPVVAGVAGSPSRFGDNSAEGSSRRAFRRTVKDDRWEPVDDPIRIDGGADGSGASPLVSVYRNPGGCGEYEPHVDLINRINNGILDRRVIQAMQAFRQRALRSKDDSGGLPQKDAEGNDIDWARLFEPAPGALWDLPPGIDIWESAQTDIQPLLAGSLADIRQLSAVTRTPLPILMPDNTNTSAAGAIATETGYIAKCQSRLTEAKIGAEAILVKALQLEGVQGLDDLTVRVEFEPVERVSTAEKYQAASMAVAVQSRRSIQSGLLGWSADEIRQDALDQADEALRNASLLRQPTGGGRSSGRPVAGVSDLEGEG